MGGSSLREELRLSEPLAASRRVCERRPQTSADDFLCEALPVRAEVTPEDVRRDDELLVVQVISQLGQVVHVRQLLPKLVTERKQEVLLLWRSELEHTEAPRGQ